MIELPQLHLNPRFQQPNSYYPGEAYTPLPFNFMPLDDSRYVAVNMTGEYVVTSRENIHALIHRKLPLDSDTFRELKSKHFVMQANSTVAIDLLAAKYRAKHATMTAFTALHMFVVTLRCDHSCGYCQVSRASEDKAAFDMSEATASKALDLALAGPTESIKIEFQGGEPLLNFDIIKYIVEEAHRRNASIGKRISFVIATNLAKATRPILEYCKLHGIHISTSIDGPSSLHNNNRPRPGHNSYELAVEGIRLARNILGRDGVSALMTTTRRSLDVVEQVVDTYIKLDFNGLFLRWLAPLGFAKKAGRVLGYPSAEYNVFYERGLRYVLSINRAGVDFREFYAQLVLSRLLRPFDTGYVDLMSPAGLGVCAVIYNYDGDVYASDEGRMLAEMGDSFFKLGNVLTSSYRDIFLSDKLSSLISSTMVESTPMCSDCAFQCICGTDPVYHYATQGDCVGHRPSSGFCSRNMFVFKLLIKMLEDEPEAAGVLRRWSNRC